MGPKRLYRSDTNKVLAGVCGGLGEYLSVDPVVLRLVWVVTTIFTGVVPGLIAYILAILIIPRPEPLAHHHTQPHHQPQS